MALHEQMRQNFSKITLANVIIFNTQIKKSIKTESEKIYRIKQIKRKRNNGLCAHKVSTGLSNKICYSECMLLH